MGISDGRGIPVPQPDAWPDAFPDHELEAIVVFPDGRWVPVDKVGPRNGCKPDGFTVTPEGDVWRRWAKDTGSAIGNVLQRALAVAR